MIPAIRAEAWKLRASLVGRIASGAIVIGIVLLSAAMLLAARAGNAQVTAKLGPDATPDWHGFLSAAIQITGAGGLAGFAIVLGWMFGREFGDRAIHGLFALPVGRGRIAAAKFVAYAGWAALVAVAMPLLLFGTGLVLGLGAPDADAVAALWRLPALTLLGLLLATPVAWAATLGRSVLAGVGVAVALIVVAQFSVLAGVGGWMPLAAPALWAMSGGTMATFGQTLLAVPFAAVFVLLTIRSWHRLQLDR